MKRMKRILTLCLVFCLTLAVIPAVPAQALTLQEQSWLEYLRPDVPKLEGSYPAYLLVSMPDGTSVKLNGTCGVGGSLDDDEIIGVLKRACSSVDGYKDPQNAVNDVVLVAAVKEKLKFTQEDMDQLQQNFLALSGFDKVADILNLTMPGVGGSDMASIAADIVQNGKPGLGFLNPIPDSIGGFAQGLIINGIFVSWEEFQRDKDKYKDIVNMSQANARLRAYYGRVDELVRDAMSDKGVWTISITDQQVVEGKINQIYDYTVPGIFTADIELIKDDGSYGNIDGTYTGHFELKMDTELTDYDNRRHILYADYMNKSQQKLPGEKISWSGVSVQVNKPTESKLTLEGENVSVSLSLPSGTNRTIFELPLDTTALEQTEYGYIEDIVYTIRGTYRDVVYTRIITEIKDDSGFQYYHDYNEAVAPGIPPVSTENEDSHQAPTDIRPYIQLTLVIDMLG